jgi:tetratricopeptide (TPR) repeat protein
LLFGGTKLKINTKVMTFLILLFLLMGYASVPMAFGAGDALDTAVRELSDYLNRRIPKGTKAVFLNVKSDWPAFSEYILDCLQENAVNDGVFTVVDRQQIDLIRAELNFQWSGEVSDKSAQEIGQMLGAQTIVSGLVTKVGSDYRIQVRAIAVQTAAVQGLTTKNVSNKGVLVTALTAAPAASSQPNSNAVAYKNRGDTYQRNGDYDRAIAEYNQALRLDPNNEAVYYNRGRAYGLKGDFDRSIADFTQTIRLNPNDADNYAMRGAGYGGKKDHARAIADFEAALRIDPNNALAKEGLEISRQARGINPSAPATPTAATYKIGDKGPAGGLIFYDKGNNNGGWRYLEAAPEEAEFQAIWSDDTYSIDDNEYTTRSDIGSGKRNTQVIVQKLRQATGNWNTAAQKANDLTLNGFNDWFLPSQGELDQIFGNLKRKNLGDFKDEYYWTSTESKDMRSWPSRFGACSQNFKDGKTDNSFKTQNRYYVRPIRQF